VRQDAFSTSAIALFALEGKRDSVPAKFRRLSMKCLVRLAFATFAIGLAAPTFAQEETPVPMMKAPFHLPVFHNDYVTLLNVNVLPGRTTGYHIHSFDQVSVNLGAADMMNQDYGSDEVSKPQRGQPGRVTYMDYVKNGSKAHKAVNVGKTPFRNISILFTGKTSGITPAARGGAYKQEIDNEHVRAWRLVLEPGQSAPQVTQNAPGIRVFLGGDQFTELAPGQPDRMMGPYAGDFFWQDAGAVRTIKNSGTTRLEFVEFEFK
jgi:hypothetical protein